MTVVAISTLEDCLCPVCRGKFPAKESCERCHSSGYVLEGCCAHDDEEHEPDTVTKVEPGIPNRPPWF